MVWLWFILISSAHAEGTLDASGLVNLIDQANQEVTRGTKSGCNLQDTAQVFTPGECLELERRTIEDYNGRELPISVVSDQKLQSLKNVYYDFYMRVDDPEVCAQRAHKIGEALALKGIETVKVYLEPGEFWPFWKGEIIPDNKTCAKPDGGGRCYVPRWPDYHVANMILVQTPTGVEEYIIDPFMEEQPVPRAKWEARLRTNPSSSIGSERIISRFNFGPGDYYVPMTEYDKAVLQRSKDIMSGQEKQR